MMQENVTSGSNFDVSPQSVRSHTGAERTPILQVNDLKIHFPIYQGIIFQRQIGAVKAVDGVNFSVERGETLGLVGESGCGKTTLGRAIIRLYKPTAGSIIFDNQDVSAIEGSELRHLRRRVQMVFQDPFASLNPRMTVGAIIAEPIIVHGGKKNEANNRAAELLKLVNLSPTFADRYPHEFSGGQRQRIAVARAIAINPEFVVADEPVSALDVSVRAQVINLMRRLQQQFGLTYLFVSHDLSVVRHVSDRIVVMYLGKIMEIADRDSLYKNPLHPYTVSLLSAVPIPDPVVEKERQRIILKGDIPSPVNPPKACRFHTRCPIAQSICSEVEPVAEDKGGGHIAACHFAGKLKPGSTSIRPDRAVQA